MAVRKVVIGVDVGGTNTDAVILDRTTQDLKVIAKAKTATTADVTTGVKNAVRLALFICRKQFTHIAVQQVNIGTTHFVNAVVEGKRLAKVSVIRLCGTASRSLPPFSDFPKELAEKIQGHTFMVNGGYQFDGTPISDVDEKEIDDCLCTLKDSGERNVVLCGIFSPARPDQELMVCELIKRNYPDISVTMSHKIGQIGLLERENAAILNESIKPLCSETIQGFRKAFDELGLQCPMYLTQNDGTIISDKKAMQFPAHTFASGATNSMRGAAYLSGYKEAIVVDIGGTSTDVGLLIKGFPREASADIKVGGIRTNFRMPDVISIGLGGGSYVTDSTLSKRKVDVGPLSAGYKLDMEALVFASDGDTRNRVVTATDIAVAAGLAEIGTIEHVKSLDRNLVTNAMNTMHDMVSLCIDKMRFSERDLPLVLVGGGSILVNKNKTIEGISEIKTPEHFDVANAVGAALSQVSASIDKTLDLETFIDTVEMENRMKNIGGQNNTKNTESTTVTVRKEFLQRAREAALSHIIEEARKEVENSGAIPESITLVEKYDVSMSYIPGNATRIKVKMVGDLQATDACEIFEIPEMKYESLVEQDAEKEKQTITAGGKKLASEEKIMVQDKPRIDDNTGEWILSEYDIECICIGSGILGCGGGGHPHIGRISALRALADGKKLRVVTPTKFLDSDNEENNLVMLTAYMGAPLIMYEKLSSGESLSALKCMHDIHSVGKYKDKKLEETQDIEVKSAEGLSFVDNYEKTDDKPITDMGEKKLAAIMCAEIGGLNCFVPMILAATLDLPLLDCDGMGRAFPEWQMISTFIYGCDPYPSVVADDKGRRAVILYADSPKRMENHFRGITVSMGCSSAVVLSHFNKEEILNFTIQHSVSHVWRLGDTVLKARAANQTPVDAVIKIENGKLLVVGKIIDVLRETTGGFNRGKIIIEGLDTYSGRDISIEFQNEFLIAKLLSREVGEVLTCVPDLITMMDCDTAQPIQTEEVRYGMRVAIVAIPAPPIMCSERALKVVGPQAFGYPDDVKYKPTAKYVDHEPVAPVK